MGIASDIAERALNHALQSVEGIYNQYDYLLERRMALTEWAEYLHLLEHGHTSADDLPVAVASEQAIRTVPLQKASAPHVPRETER